MTTKTGHKPQRGRTMEQRLWNWMRSQKRPVRIPEIAEHFEWKPTVARAVMRRLQARGSAVGTGYSNARTFTATKIRPDDLRGSAEASLKALMRRAKAIRNPNKRIYNPRTYPGIELEKVWKP